ncbi:hypothetical protein [Enterobacter sp. R4-368]|uniref:hypothetical protein n=1 Tax=Enterobacter sp. R4-368 TaxID=1166130 RepID=UPI001675C040|nr:hypothetical protein [Enterobacter sp. R4-368]
MLATNREYSQQRLTRIKFLSSLLWRNLSHQYVVMFNGTFSHAEIAACANANQKEKMRQFRDNVYRLPQALYL